MSKYDYPKETLATFNYIEKHISEKNKKDVDILYNLLLKLIKQNGFGKTDTPEIDALRRVIKNIKLHTLKKPIFRVYYCGDNNYVGRCPNCCLHINSTEKKCVCGQWLDWESVDEDYKKGRIKELIL